MKSILVLQEGKGKDQDHIFCEKAVKQLGGSLSEAYFERRMRSIQKE